MAGVSFKQEISNGLKQLSAIHFNPSAYQSLCNRIYRGGADGREKGRLLGGEKYRTDWIAKDKDETWGGGRGIDRY